MVYLVWLLGALLFSLCDFDLLHTMQRSGYRPKEYFATLTLRVYAPPMMGTVAGVGFVYLIAFTVENWIVQFAGIAAPLFAVYAVVWTRAHCPPLKFTKRCLRLSAAVLLCNLALTGAVAFAAFAAENFVATAAFLIAAQIFVVPFAAWVMIPCEKRLARRFERAARTKLARVAPKVIGITGSYGKTSVKNFLRDLLSVRYRVCASPENYNTPMGLCITVNEHLGEDDEVLIAEMGARYRGDIAELCALVSPDVAVITGIGTQHLATFGSVEALRDTKYEIVEGLKAGGPAFFGEGEGCRALFARGYGEAHLVGDPRDRYYVAFADVRVDPTGSAFTVVTREKRFAARTRLLGAQHLANLRLACTVARCLGLSAAELETGIARVKPVPHRLELLPAAGGVQVVDDSYNASAEGIEAAANALALFPPCRVVITPGIIEAGAETYMVNYRAGSALGGAADDVWFYGPNVRALRDGALSAGMRESRVHLAKDRDEAVRATAALPVPRVILFCNDLPV